MKRFFLIAIAALGLSSCGGEAVNQTETVSVNKDHLEIYCFHGTRQCETCKNMKSNTKSTLDKYFSKHLVDSTIIFSIIDVDDPANAEIAEKYEATGTALMINHVKNGKDNIEDWSDFAFEKANNKDEFVPELKSKIEDIIK